MLTISHKNDKAINSLNLIDKLTGLIFMTDLNQNFTLVNKTLVHWSGYRNDDQILGRSYDKMRCKATEYADVFSKQDIDVITYQKSSKIFGGFYYAKNLWRLLLGEKCPIQDNKNQIMGVVGHFIDVTNSKFINLSSALKQLDRHYQIKKNNHQFNYTINDEYHSFNITEREAECLFYFIRGKSYKEISNILNISSRTVEKHISNIKLKTKCNSTSLIEESINNGFINTIPKCIFEKELPF